MASQYAKAESGDDPTTDAFWTALGYTPPSNKADFSAAGTVINTQYGATSGTSDILHIAPGTYDEDVAFTSASKAQEIKVYGEVIINGQGGSYTLLTQNTLKTFTKGLTSVDTDKFVITGTAATYAVRAQGSASQIWECDFELRNHAKTFYIERAGSTPIWVIFQGEFILRGELIANSSSSVGLSLTDGGTSPFMFFFCGGFKVNANYEKIFNSNAAAVASSIAITAITNASPAVVTVTNTFAEGQPVFIDAIVGMTEINAQWFQATNVTSSTIELTAMCGGLLDTSDTAKYTAYSSAGTIVDPCAFIVYEAPLGKVNQITGRARFVGDLSNSGWDVTSATGNQCRLYSTTILPTEWEVASRANVISDDLLNLSSSNYYLEGVAAALTPQFNPGQVDPGGYDSSSKYVTESFSLSRMKARRKVYISLQSDDWYDTFNYLATQTVDTRVKATLALAYSQTAAFDLRVSDTTINENSLPGSTTATAGQGYDASSVVTSFWTPANVHVAAGHEICLHSGRHSQLGYAELIDITYNGNVSITTDYDAGTGDLTFESGALSDVLDLTDYDEIDELITALDALSGVTAVVNNQGSDRSKFAGPLTLATIGATSCTSGVSFDRDWTSTHKDEVINNYDIINGQLTGTPTSFIYPVGWMSNELIAIMEDDTTDAPLVGGRQVFPTSDGVTVDQIKAPYFKPLDNGWEPFRTMCINAGSSWGQTYPQATKTQIQESVRRWMEWFKWHGGLLSIYSHGLSEMTLEDINRWEWVIEAIKPYIDAGEAEYTTLTDGINKMKARDSGVKSAGGRGGNDIYTYTFTDQYDDIQSTSLSGGGGGLALTFPLTFDLTG